jgi:heat shock protein HslJ
MKAAICTVFFMLVFGVSRPLGAAENGVLRYRGQYIYGHEVNIFCPAINSQCYWVDGGTDVVVRRELRALAPGPDAPPYTAVCVVIEGRIDRDLPRSGFAANYDGLIVVTRVFGGCAETAIVAEGDLQHHRWLLESIDGETLDAVPLGGRIPELDFGEQMTVTGNSGCNELTGQAVLGEAFFVIRAIASTRRVCTRETNELEDLVLGVLANESVIRIQNRQTLILESDRGRLRFRLEDWK